MAKVCWFNDLVSLAVAWNSIPHTQLSNVFYDDATQKCRFIQVEEGDEEEGEGDEEKKQKENDVRVAGLSLFQTGVKPEWEDTVNTNGGEIRIDFKSNLKTLQKLWNKLLLAVVGGEFKNADYIAGIRALDKSQAGRESIFRIEVWTKFDSSSEDSVKQLKTHLQEEYVKMMIEDEGTFSMAAKQNQDKAEEWLAEFKNHSKEAASKPRGDRPPYEGRGERRGGDRGDRGGRHGGHYKSGPAAAQ